METMTTSEKTWYAGEVGKINVTTKDNRYMNIDIPVFPAKNQGLGVLLHGYINGNFSYINSEARKTVYELEKASGIIPQDTPYNPMETQYLKDVQACEGAKIEFQITNKKSQGGREYSVVSAYRAPQEDPRQMHLFDNNSIIPTINQETTSEETTMKKKEETKQEVMQEVDGGVIDFETLYKATFGKVPVSNSEHNKSFLQDKRFEGRQPTMEIKKLNVNGIYQRTDKINKKRILDICNNFEPWRVNDVVVSQKTHSVIDGMHTILACIMLGISEVPTRVIYCPTVADEAREFKILNKRENAVTALNIFKAGLAERAEEETGIMAILNKHKIDKICNKAKSPNAIDCPSALRELYKKGVLDISLLNGKKIEKNYALEKNFLYAIADLVLSGIDVGAYAEKLALDGAQKHFKTILNGNAPRVHNDGGRGKCWKLCGDSLLECINFRRKRKVCKPENNTVKFTPNN